MTQAFSARPPLGVLQSVSIFSLSDLFFHGCGHEPPPATRESKNGQAGFRDRNHEIADAVTVCLRRIIWRGTVTAQENGTVPSGRVHTFLSLLSLY
jgi:hypothetical protein